MRVNTLLRNAEHKALKSIVLSGSILDLGGETRSEYRSLIQGEHRFTTVNLEENEAARPDIYHDLEKPLPIEDAAYDHVLLINVLEHIYNYRQLLSESARVMNEGGTLVLVVPFLFPVHPSPHDFRRFTKEALLRECIDAGFKNIDVTPLGSGVFAAQFVLFDRLLPTPLRFLHLYLCAPLVSLGDYLFTMVAHIFGKKYDPSDYALGYVVTAKRYVSDV